MHTWLKYQKFKSLIKDPIKNCTGRERTSTLIFFKDLSTTPVSVRLQGPSSTNGSGRVEVYYHGQWGTICDDGWDFRDARVVCRQLGYPEVARVLRENQVPSGSGEIWLSHIACTGEEQNITSCTHSDWGSMLVLIMKTPELSVLH